MTISTVCTARRFLAKFYPVSGWILSTDLGRAERNVTLEAPARLVIVVGQTGDGQAGEPSAVTEAIELPGVRLLFRDSLGDGWSELPFSLNRESGESVSISLMRDRFGVFALIADVEQPVEAAVEATVQVSTPTITPTATPTVEISDLAEEHPGAAFGPVIAALAAYLAMLWYLRALGMRQ